MNISIGLDKFSTIVYSLNMKKNFFLQRPKKYQEGMTFLEKKDLGKGQMY